MATIRVGPSARRPKSTVERVAVDDVEPAGIARRDLAERRKTALVALDGDHLPRARGEERAGQAAGSRADLDDGDAAEVAGRARDPRRQVEVEEEILAERL